MHFNINEWYLCLWYVPNGRKLLLKKNGWYNHLIWFAKYNVDCRSRSWFTVCKCMTICKFVSSLVVFSVAAFTCFHLWPMAWMVLCPMRKTASGQDSSGWGPGISSSWSTKISKHSMQNFKKFCCLKYYFS